MSNTYIPKCLLRSAAVLAFTLGISFAARAQAPTAFKFQAMARDAQDQPIAGREVAVRVSLLQGDAVGDISYSERHVVTTSEIGIFDLAIGTGLVLEGNMETIDWGSDSYFLQIDMDPDGGANYVGLGATQLLSVPYALYANEAGSGSGGNPTDELQQLVYDPATKTLTISDGNTVDLSSLSSAGAAGDPTDEIQQITRTDDLLTLSLGGGSVDIRDADADPANELQQISLEGNVLTLNQNGGSVTLPSASDSADADADPTNEIQDISLTGRELAITGGSTVILPEEVDGDVTNEIQQISTEGSILRLSHEGGEVNVQELVDVNDADADATNELQQISLQGNILTLTQNGGTVTLPSASDYADADADPTNEIQDISLTGRELTITGGSTVTLPEDNDGDAANEIQQISTEGSVLRLSHEGGEVNVQELVDVNDADADPTNEIQDISLTGRELAITGGSTVTLPEELDADPANELQQISLQGNILTLTQNGGSVTLPSASDYADADADPTNEIQDISLTGRELTITGGSTITLPEDNDGDATNEIQDISLAGRELTITGGSTITLPDDHDGDATNELQQISLQGNILTLTQNGGSITLPSASDYADADADPTNEIQDISLTGRELTITGGSTISLPGELDGDVTNEIQQLTAENGTLRLSHEGGEVNVQELVDVNDADADPTNEIQDISLTGRELTITGGSTIVLPEDNDGDAGNEIQQLTAENGTLRLSHEGGEVNVQELVDVNDADADATNELQQISLQGNILTLTQNGGSITLPSTSDYADADADPTNEIQDISLTGRELTITGGSTITLPGETDGDVTNEIQQLTAENGTLRLSHEGGEVNVQELVDVNDADADPTNEIQDISLAGRELTITGGSTITLPEENDGDVTNEIQQISIEGNVLTLNRNGGSITLPSASDYADADADPTNEIQDISLTGRELTITGGSTVTLPEDNDGDAMNEIQKFNFEGHVNPRVLLSENDANFRLFGGKNIAITRTPGLGDIYFDVELPEELDADPTNEIQKFNFEGHVNPRVLLSENDANFRLFGGKNVSITRPSHLGDIYFDVDLPENLDVDPANELQQLSLTSGTLSLSQNGGRVTMRDLAEALGPLVTAGDADADPSNEIQKFNFEGSVNPRVLLSENDANFRLFGGKNVKITRPNNLGDIYFDVDLPESLDSDSRNEIQQLGLTSDALTLSRSGGKVSLRDLADALAPMVPAEDETNEIQRLTLSGNTLTLSRNGGSVTLPSGGLSSGGSDADSDPMNELQKFNFEGSNNPRVLLSRNNANFRLIGGRNTTISRSNGDITIDVANDGDGDSRNELQKLSLSGNTLSLSGNGGSVTLPSGGSGSADADADPKNEIQEFRFEGTVNPRVLLSRNNANFQFVSGQNILISRPSGKGQIVIDALIPREADGDPTNELQQLTYDENARKLMLSRGGSVDLNPIINEAEARLQSMIDTQKALNDAMQQNIENLQKQVAELQKKVTALANGGGGVLTD